MTEFLITNGEVSFEHKYPRGDYDSAIPRVAYSFTIAEGSDPLVVTAKVMAMAVSIVEAAAQGKQVQFEQPHHKVEVEAPKQTRARKVPNQIVPPTTPSLVPEAPAPTLVPSAPVSDTASVVSLVPSDPGIDAADEDADLLGLPQEDQPAKEVTDLDLQQIAMPLSAKLRENGGNVGKLRELISAAGGGSVLTTIPQDKRAGFVVAAKKLLASL